MLPHFMARPYVYVVRSDMNYENVLLRISVCVSCRCKLRLSFWQAIARNREEEATVAGLGFKPFRVAKWSHDTRKGIFSLSGFGKTISQHDMGGQGSLAYRWTLNVIWCAAKSSIGQARSLDSARQNEKGSFPGTESIEWHFFSKMSSIVLFSWIMMGTEI
jgi:hypothetical protein